jgi:26S proteasome regulatory subunit N8
MRSLPFGTPHPVLVLVDVRPETEGLPVQSYQTVERVVEGKESQRTFVHIPCEVGAFEAEEVGVEHLLRDINDPSVSSTAAELRHQLNGLRGLRSHLGEAVSYLNAVIEGKMPANRSILYHLQSVLSSLPNSTAPALIKSLHESNNDSHLTTYLATLTRSVLALHDTLNNKAGYAAKEKEQEEGTGNAGDKDKKKKEGDKAEEDGKDGKKKDEGASKDEKK